MTWKMVGAAPDAAPHDPNGSTSLIIQLLGDFTVSVDGRRIEASSWRLRRASQIVKLLALDPGHQLDREEIMATLWPDASPDAAANNLRSALYVARQILSPDVADEWLVRDGSQIELSRSRRVWVDVEAFEQAAALARHGRDAALYDAALARYSGDLLPDERYEAWAESRRWILHEEFISLLLELSGIYEDDAEVDLAIDTLQRALASDPAHEDAHAGLMRIYTGMGLPHQALRQYDHLCQVLRSDLDTEPDPATVRLMNAIRSGDLTRAERPNRVIATNQRSPARHNISLSLSSFVGREPQLAEMSSVLSVSRLLTLTGPPGCGKTRLALEHARSVRDCYPDGVWFVDLEALIDPTRLIDHLGGVLLGDGWLPGMDRHALVEALRPRTSLLLLNGCGHMVRACRDLVWQLLTECPGLTVMVTSRESLEIPGEIVRVVPPLMVPSRDQRVSDNGVMDSEAIQLFNDRAAAVAPDFRLTPATWRAFAGICEACDGLPLAIEMTATHVKALSVEEILARLDNPLTMLTGGLRLEWQRNPTFRAALEASYHRLHQPEQALFRRLAMFSGDWTLAAAERIASAWQDLDGDLIGQLESLTSKSLIVHHVSSGFSLLNTIRAFGLEQLHANNEYERALEIHHFTHSP
jgi:predicted ATPase/DNA-binding SARP family transcriptional activator